MTTASRVTAIAEAAERTSFDASRIDAMLARREQGGWRSLEEDEIDELCSYLVEAATAQRLHVERTRALIENDQRMYELTRDAHERSQRALERACACAPGYEVISDEQA